MEQTETHEIKFTLQTGGNRKIIQSFKNPIANTETILTGISQVNLSLSTNDFWYEDPKTSQEAADYSDENKIIKIVKADIFDQTKTVDGNKVTLVEVTETVYNEEVA